MADADDHDKHETGFLDLARELRDKIYELALCDSDRKHSGSGRGRETKGCAFWTGRTFKSLRSTNRQVSAEAFSAYYNKQAFHLTLECSQCSSWGDATSELCLGYGKYEHYLCDDALSAVRDLTVYCGISSQRHLWIRLKFEGGTWVATCEWYGEWYGEEDGEEEMQFEALIEPDFKTFCAGLAQPRDGGLECSDFEGIKDILAKGVVAQGRERFRWMDQDSERTQ